MMSVFRGGVKSQNSRAISGFTLIEILVAMGLLGILSLGVTKLMETLSKGNRGARQAADFISFGSTVQQVLNDGTSCTKGLIQPNAANTVPSDLTNASDPFFAERVLNSPNGNIIIAAPADPTVPTSRAPIQNGLHIVSFRFLPDGTPLSSGGNSTFQQLSPGTPPNAAVPGDKDRTPVISPRSY